MSTLREILDYGFVQWVPKSLFIDNMKIFQDRIIVKFKEGVYGRIPLPKEILVFSPCSECRILMKSGKEFATKIINKKTKMLVSIPKDAHRAILPTRAWVKKYFKELSAWIDTLEIAVSNNVESRPSYINEAIKIFEELKLSKSLFFDVATKFLGKKVSRGAGRTVSPRLYLNWIAYLISRCETPKFEWIGIKGHGISNPRLPLIIRSPKTAKLLGIWSKTLSFYEVKGRSGRAKNIVASSSNEMILKEINAQIEALIGKIKPFVEVRNNIFYYRYRNVILAAFLMKAGARMGRKSKILVDWRMPKWILNDKACTLNWFKGVFLEGANARIIPSKHHYEIYYSRGIEINSNVINKKVLGIIKEYGQKSAIANMIQISSGTLINSLDIKEPPIISAEKYMLSRILGKIDIARARVDRFIFFPTEKRLVAEWIISIYGKNNLKELIELSILPKRLLNKLYPFTK